MIRGFKFAGAIAACLTLAQIPVYLTRGQANALYAPLGSTVSTSSSNNFASSTTQTISGRLAINGLLTTKSQIISLDGGTHTIDPTLGTVVVLVGSTAGTTVKMPLSPVADTELDICYAGTGSVSVTLDGNGNNIVDTSGSASTQSIAASRTIDYISGTGWVQKNLTLSGILNRANTWALLQTLTSGVTSNGDATFNRQLVCKRQAITISTGTTSVDPINGTVLDVSGSASGATIQLTGASSGTPPPDGTIVEILNRASASWTLSSNGSNVDGGSTITVSNSRTMVYTSSNGWYALHLTQAQADARYGQLGAANNWTAANVFTGSLTANGGLTVGSTFTANNAVVWGRQTFSATGSISATGATLVEFTGATGQTITTPSPSAGLWYLFWNSSANTVTLSASPNNFTDLAASSISVPATSAVMIVSDSGGWHSIGFGLGYANATYGRLAAVNTWSSQQNVSGTLNSTGQFTQSGRWSLSSQTIATTGGTLTALSASATSAYLIILTGSSSGTTLPMPGTPNANQTFTIKNASSVTVTISGNGNNLEATGTPGSYSSTTTLAPGQSRTWRFNASTYDIIAGYG